MTCSFGNLSLKITSCCIIEQLYALFNEELSYALAMIDLEPYLSQFQKMHKLTHFFKYMKDYLLFRVSHSLKMFL